MLAVRGVAMPRFFLTTCLPGDVMAAMPPAWRGCLPALPWAVLLAGCRDPRFDVTETLPAHPGVSSTLVLLKEGEERRALRNQRKGHEQGRAAVVVQQVIRNDSDDDLGVYRHPQFEAELIVVK